MTRKTPVAGNSEESATKPKRRRGPGRPFKKGQSGNPDGRPKALRDLKDRIQLRGDELVDKLFALALDPPKIVRRGGRAVVDGPGARERIMAAEKLLAYGYGRPVLAVEVSGPGGGPMETREIDKLTSAERAQRLISLFMKAGARAVAEPDGDGGPGGG